MLDIVSLEAIPEQGDDVFVDFTSMGVQDGDVLFWSARSQASPATNITPPTGWARGGTLGTVPAGDRFLGTFFKPVPVASGAVLTATFTGVAGGGNSRILSVIGVLRGADLAHLNDGGQKYQPNATIPEGAAGGVPYAVLAFWGAEFTAGNSVVPTSTPSGFSVEMIAQTAGGDPAVILDNSITTGSRTGGVLLSNIIESGSLDIPALTTSWTGTATDPKAASWVVRGLAGEQPIGIPVKDGNGATTYLSYIDGAGVRKAPASVRMTLPPFTVTDMLASPGVTMGHRGASAVPGEPEMSRRGYRYAATQRGYRLLEFSTNRTSDGVYVGCHDASINRTSQTTGLADLSAMTWAEVQAHQNSLNSGGNPVPYYRLEDFLDEFAREATVHVDPKYNTGGISDFLDVLDAHAGPDRVVLKYTGVGVGPDALAIAARARGYLAATYAFENDWSSGALDASEQYWDILGLPYDASTAAWSQTTEGAFPGIRSYGKPVLAHIIPDQAAYNLAQSKIAEGGWITAGGTWIAQVSGVNVVSPVSGP